MATPSRSASSATVATRKMASKVQPGGARSSTRQRRLCMETEAAARHNRQTRDAEMRLMSEGWMVEGECDGPRSARDARISKRISVGRWGVWWAQARLECMEVVGSECME